MGHSRCRQEGSLVEQQCSSATHVPPECGWIVECSGRAFQVRLLSGFRSVGDGGRWFSRPEPFQQYAHSCTEMDRRKNERAQKEHPGVTLLESDADTGAKNKEQIQGKTAKIRPGH